MIEEHDVKALGGNLVEALHPALGRRNLDFRGFQEALEHEQVHAVVVDDQHLGLRRDEGFAVRLLALDERLDASLEVADGHGVVDFLRKRDREGRAFAVSAFHINRAMHHLDKAQSD